MIYSKIIGTGSFLPKHKLTNAELAKKFMVDEDWFYSRTGIIERSIVADNETTSDIAEHAARRALESANILPEDLDLIIVATSTPDLAFPSTACLLQQKLGNTTCPAFDIQAACTGFIYALDIADKYIKLGTVRNALVVGAETLSKIQNWNDKETLALFGDGSGAVVLTKDSNFGVYSTKICSNGEHSDLLKTNGGISVGYNENIYPIMNGGKVFKQAVVSMGSVVDEILFQNNLTKDDIKWLIPHQANKRIIQAITKKYNLSDDRVIITIDKHANTSAATIPLALDDAVRSKKVKSGDLCVLVAFGAGFTWGASLLRY